MTLVRRIVEEVAVREGTAPTNLPPLYDQVDPDALAMVVESADADTLSVEFTYDDCIVRVDGDGSVNVIRY